MTKRKTITRKGTEHAVFGQADPLPAQTQHALCSVHTNFHLMVKRYEIVEGTNVRLGCE